MDSDYLIFDSENFYIQYDVSEYEDDEDNTHTEMDWDQDLYDELFDMVSSDFDEWKSSILKVERTAHRWNGTHEGVKYYSDVELKEILSDGCDFDKLEIYKDNKQYLLVLYHHDGANYYYINKIDMSLTKKNLTEEAESACNHSDGWEVKEILQKLSDNLYPSNATKQDFLDVIQEVI